jgi:lysophospholipase L1-like esterase
MADILDLNLGRILLPTAENEVQEALGATLEAAGAVILTGEVRPRARRLTVPIYADDNGGFDAEMMRRQVRAYLNNSLATAQGTFFKLAFDRDLEGWLIIGGGDLTYSKGGPTFNHYSLELTDAYAVGTSRTHRRGLHIRGIDRTLITTPRDLKGTLFSTDFSSTAFPYLVAYLPAGQDIVNQRGRARVDYQKATRKAFGGDIHMVFRPDDGDTWTVDGADRPSLPGDVVAYRKRRALTFGHSITVGAGATDPVNENWGALLQVSTRGEVVVSAGGGVRLMHENVSSGNQYGYARYLQDINPGPFKGNYCPFPYSWVGSFMGVNDAGYIGSAGLDALKYDNALTGFLSRINSYAVYESDTFPWEVVSGTWTTVATTANTKASGANYKQATVNGAVYRFTTPTIYNGGGVAIGFWVPHTNVADCTISVDGISLGTFSLRGVDFADVTASRGTMRIIRLNETNTLGQLTPGAHKIDITAANISGGGIVAPDFAQLETLNPVPCILFEQFYLLDPSLFATTFTLTPTVIDKLNAAINRVAAQFPMTRVIPTNGHITAAELIVDGLHPNTAGYRKLADIALPTLVDLMETRR